MKTIKFNLSEESINSAINELNTWNIKLQKCEDKILKRLGEYAHHQMELHLFESVKVGVATGALESSIKEEYAPHLARIFTNMFYASYVEYGTGVTGRNNPHPDLPEGWTYGDTTGQIAHQFVYRTYIDLKENYVDIAMEVLREEGLIE